MKQFWYHAGAIQEYSLNEEKYYTLDIAELIVSQSQNLYGIQFNVGLPPSHLNQRYEENNILSS
jgi:hypothetical protein